MRDEMRDLRGHNMPEGMLKVQVRLFNAVAGAVHGPAVREVELPHGSTVRDVVESLAIPLEKVFLILRNGRDITPTLQGALNVEEFLEDGDVIAFSGPVPYSAGYGAPVV